MILTCDLHVHSALSPCADAEMTPGNIVAMARLLDIDVVAITDHQTCANCAAAIHLSEQSGGPLVIPGIEVESQEEIHLVCLLPDLAAARKLEKIIRDHLPDIANRPDIFGEQIIYDESDQPAGTEKQLLLQACSLDSESIARLTAGLGGVCLPAHVDRDSYSILTVLGAIPPEFPAKTLEISLCADLNRLLSRYPALKQYSLIRSSDAHRLSELAQAGWPIEVSIAENRPTAADVIRALNSEQITVNSEQITDNR